MVIELLKRGADPNKEKGYNGTTPLHLAITGDKLHLVEKLLKVKKRADLETRDDFGYTPLLEAVNYCASEDIVDLLLEHGADMHAVTEDEKTVLHFAAQYDNKDMIRKMLERGLSVDAKDKDGWTPLHEAALYGSKAAADILIEKGQLLILIIIHYRAT